MPEEEEEEEPCCEVEEEEDDDDDDVGDDDADDDGDDPDAAGCELPEAPTLGTWAEGDAAAGTANGNGSDNGCLACTPE